MARFRKVRRTIVALSLSGWILVGLLLGVEFGVRFYISRLPANDLMFQLCATPAQIVKRQENGLLKFSSHPLFGVCLTPNYRQGRNRHNTLGFRGEEIVLPKPAGEFRIACMGGSTTYDDNIEDFTLAYPAVLQRELQSKGYRVTVVNAGVPTWTSRQTLSCFCTRILDVGADMIIVNDAINDLAARSIWPPKLYDSQYTRTLDPLLYKLIQNANAFSSTIRIIQLALRPSPFVDEISGEQTWGWLFADLENQVNDGSYPSGLLKQVSVKQALAANPPTYFARNIENTAILAAHRSVSCVLATFPINAGESHWRQFPDAQAQFVAGIDEMNREIRTVAERVKSPLLDLASAMPQDGQYYADDMHSNEKGAALKAKLVADFLEANHLLPSNAAK